MLLHANSRVVRAGGALLAGGAVLAGLLASAAPASAGSVPPSAWKDVWNAAPAQSCANGPDQTSLFQQIINRAPNGTLAHPTVINLPAGACYVIDGTVNLDQRANLVINGNSSQPATFYRQGTGDCSSPYSCHIFFLWGGANISFDNVNVESNNTQHVYNANNAGEAAWWVWGTQGLTLSHDSVQNVWGDFVTLGPDTYHTWMWANNVSITNDVFNGSGRQGIAITGAENVDISNDVLTNAALSDFDLEADSGTGPTKNGVPTYGGAGNVTIENNVVGHAGTVFLSNDGFCSQDFNITVSHNNLKGQAFDLWSKGCNTVERTGWNVTYNTSDTALASPRGAFEFTYVTNSVVSNNDLEFYAPEKGTAVKVWGSSGITVANNSFSGAAQVTSIDPPVWSGPASQNVVSTGNTTN